MAKKKSIRVDFVKSCITYNKLNMITKIAISGIEKMIKRVRLDYKPVAKRTSEEAAFVVSAEHVAAINKSIEKKLERNKRERRESEKEAEKFIVR